MSKECGGVPGGGLQQPLRQLALHMKHLDPTAKAEDRQEVRLLDQPEGHQDAFRDGGVPQSGLAQPIRCEPPGTVERIQCPALGACPEGSEQVGVGSSEGLQEESTSQAQVKGAKGAERISIGRSFRDARAPGRLGPQKDEGGEAVTVLRTWQQRIREQEAGQGMVLQAGDRVEGPSRGECSLRRACRGGGDKMFGSNGLGLLMGCVMYEYCQDQPGEIQGLLCHAAARDAEGAT